MVDAVPADYIWQHKTVHMVVCRTFAADTESTAIITELRSFLRAENYNGYELQLSTPAYEKAASYLESASKTIRLSQLKPEFTPDGDGGIDIEWERNGRRLALNIGSSGQDNFISWREPNGRYEGGPATGEILTEKLHWLAR